MSGDTVQRAGGPPQAVPPHSPAEARRRVQTLLHQCFCPADEMLWDDIVLADALLVTSELVTNAVRHAGGLTGFAAEVTDGGLRLSVEDACDDLPQVRAAPASGRPRCHGHGWPLVQRVASRVAVRTLPGGGKRITVLVPLV